MSVARAHLFVSIKWSASLGDGLIQTKSVISTRRLALLSVVLIPAIMSDAEHELHTGIVWRCH